MNLADVAILVLLFIILIAGITWNRSRKKSGSSCCSGGSCCGNCKSCSSQSSCRNYAAREKDGEK